MNEKNDEMQESSEREIIKYSHPLHPNSYKPKHSSFLF